MTIRVLAFARIREIIGAAEIDRSLAPEATVRTLWDDLARDFPALAELRASSRVARDGALIAEIETLAPGDRIALLPAFGGG